MNDYNEYLGTKIIEKMWNKIDLVKDELDDRIQNRRTKNKLPHNRNWLAEHNREIMKAFYKKMNRMSDRHD